MSESSKPLIFLTGCINPAGMSHTALQDPEVRKSQYIEAIKFYLLNTDLPILFVENSNTPIPIGEFKDFSIDNRLELITFDGNNYNKELGKGYGEMLIIEHALKFSLFIRTAEFVFKITGRYKILNISSFIIDYKTSQSYNLLIDLKENLSFSDSRFLGCVPSFFSEILLKYKDRVNDSIEIFFEHALCNATHEAIIRGYRFSFLKFKPRYSGTYGTDNTVYNDSWTYWFPRNLKYILKYKLLNK
ncbi:hypothetical protein JAO76_09490 [Pontibacter sp. BT310]|uniref:Uncharacterized protein n=1 Tax=Pontibacter populi TaxID=890055 RepID=A0ABS6XBB1_9BACT|nr:MULTISPECIES: hypothetical protein [Pontibacter]MBJ6118424.1 hypothetical protein [Pontibacter sp. BT310]MBR0570852.1 hypothetical protein [Microvirga sp. STS03]MBW3365278.1 hypothetical protein [Pontibacter populi]